MLNVKECSHLFTTIIFLLFHYVSFLHSKTQPKTKKYRFFVKISIIQMDTSVPTQIKGSFTSKSLTQGWTGYLVQYPISGEIRPFFSYLVSGRILDIKKPDIRFPNIRQTYETFFLILEDLRCFNSLSNSVKRQTGTCHEVLASVLE